MTTYHFLDESGDPGLSGAPSSSRYLAVAIVELDNREPLPILAAVRDYLHLPSGFEFKYHTTTRLQREVFFRALELLRFRLRVVVLSKGAAPGIWTALDGEDRVADLAVRLILRNVISMPARSILVVDGAKLRHLRALRTRLSEGCRLRSARSPYSRIVGGDSAREDGLQVADMMVGAVRNYVVTGERTEYATFAGKVDDLWVC